MYIYIFFHLLLTLTFLCTAKFSSIKLFFPSTYMNIYIFAVFPGSIYRTQSYARLDIPKKKKKEKKNESASNAAVIAG